MGNPKKDTKALTLRVNINTITKLMSTNPSLITRNPSTGENKFRHGALGRYIERLILEDCTRREKPKPEINARTLTQDEQDILQTVMNQGKLDEN